MFLVGQAQAGGCRLRLASLEGDPERMLCEHVRMREGKGVKVSLGPRSRLELSLIQ